MVDMKDVKKQIWILKEGAVVGLIIGLVIYFLKVSFITNALDSWFGPFTRSQLLFVLLYVCVSLGIIFDAVYKPKK
jgi:hypothetical protein